MRKKIIPPLSANCLLGEGESANLPARRDVVRSRIVISLHILSSPDPQSPLLYIYFLSHHCFEQQNAFNGIIIAGSALFAALKPDVIHFLTDNTSGNSEHTDEGRKKSSSNRLKVVWIVNKLSVCIINYSPLLKLCSYNFNAFSCFFTLHTTAVSPFLPAIKAHH